MVVVFYSFPKSHLWFPKSTSTSRQLLLPLHSKPTHLKGCVFIYRLVSDVSDGEESACNAAWSHLHVASPYCGFPLIPCTFPSATEEFTISLLSSLLETSPDRIPLQASFPSRSTSLFPNDSDCNLATSIPFCGHDLDLIVTNNSWKTSVSIPLFSDHSLHSSSSFTCQHFFTAPHQLFQPIFYSLPHLLS